VAVKKKKSKKAEPKAPKMAAEMMDAGDGKGMQPKGKGLPFGGGGKKKMSGSTPPGAKKKSRKKKAM